MDDNLMFCTSTLDVTLRNGDDRNKANGEEKINLVDMLESSSDVDKRCACPTRHCFWEFFEDQCHSKTPFGMNSVDAEAYTNSYFVNTLIDVENELAREDVDSNDNYVFDFYDYEWDACAPVTDEIGLDSDKINLDDGNLNFGGGEGEVDRTAKQQQELFVQLQGSGLVPVLSFDGDELISNLPEFESLNTKSLSRTPSSNESFPVCERMDDSEPVDDCLHDHWRCQRCGKLKNKEKMLALKRFNEEVGANFHEYICKECDELERQTLRLAEASTETLMPSPVFMGTQKLSSVNGKMNIRAESAECMPAEQKKESPTEDGSNEKESKDGNILDEENLFNVIAMLKTEKNDDELFEPNDYDLSPERYHCEECNKTFTYHYWYRKHMEQKHQHIIITFPCTSCSETFLSRPLLLNHEKCHLEVRNFRCSECGQRFRMQHHLTRHFSSMHTPQKQYSCRACVKKFSSLCSARAHERNSKKCHRIISLMSR